MKIFLIIFDSLRKDHTGKTYGNDWIHTPNFDAFAKDSIVFDKAFPESLATIPVRRAIHTGIRTFPFNNDMLMIRTDDYVSDPGWFPIPPYQKHIGEYMKNFRYITSFITSTYHQFKPNMNFHLGFDQFYWVRGQEIDKYRAELRKTEPEIEDMLARHLFEAKKYRAMKKYQKITLEMYLRNVQDRTSEEDYFPAQTYNKAIEFVKDTKTKENTLALIDEFDPHEPWDPPEKYLDLYKEKDYSGNKIIQPIYSDNTKCLTDSELKFLRASYAGEVSMCDHWFGRFINILKELEIYDESLIIFLSDHGHCIGERGVVGKIPQFLYPELTDIPFMIKPPGGISGPKRIKKSYVYVHDILPTLFGFLNKEKLDVFDGVDLSIFRDEDDHLLNNRNYITCGYERYTLYRDDQYALITSNDKKEQKLYDLRNDPEWKSNTLYDNPQLCEELFEKIEADAKGELLTEFKPLKFDEIKELYDQRLK
jgi:arylsulfatase A-like enzyme